MSREQPVAIAAPRAGAQPAAGTARGSLAVVMMTKNEAHRLAQCLDRVAGWADEIVIIDDFSTDGTVEIAKRYTDRVVQAASEDNHSRQWNRGIDAATAEWILHIDADEWVTPELKAAISRMLIGGTTHSAFRILRLNYFLGRPMRHGGWHHPHLILFRRDKTRCLGRGIHALRQIEGTIGFMPADILHFPFDSIGQFLARQNQYTSVEARIMREDEPPVPQRAIRYQMVIKPMKLLWKFLVKRHAYQDGMHGIVFAGLFAFTHFMLWAKYAELSQQPAETERPEPSP